MDRSLEYGVLKLKPHCRDSVHRGRYVARANSTVNAMSKTDDKSTASAVMLQTGFLTSTLLLLAASILWGTFIIALPKGGPSDKIDAGGTMIGAISLINAAMFYCWGLSGLAKTRKHLKEFERGHSSTEDAQ